MNTLEKTQPEGKIFHCARCGVECYAPVNLAGFVIDPDRHTLFQGECRRSYYCGLCESHPRAVSWWKAHKIIQPMARPRRITAKIALEYFNQLLCGMKVTHWKATDCTRLHSDHYENSGQPRSLHKYEVDLVSNGLDHPAWHVRRIMHLEECELGITIRVCPDAGLTCFREMTDWQVD